MTLSFGSLSGWATINFVEFQKTNTSLPIGPLSLKEATVLTSIANVGGLIGNFAVLPIGYRIGIKKTIHLLCAPLIVS